MAYRNYLILFLPQTTRLGASSRARIYEYLSFLSQDGCSFKVVSGTSEKLDAAFLSSPTLLQKIAWFLGKIVGRLGTWCSARRFDCVVIHRETLPYLFPLTELILRKRAKHLVFDFDDAIYCHPSGLKGWKRVFADPHSTRRIIQCADRVIVSTPYLADYARRFNSQVVVIPTGVRFSDYQKVEPHKEDRLVIGWIGSPSTQQYIYVIEECLKALAGKYLFIFRVIGANNFSMPGVPIEEKPWSLENEVNDVASFTIGVMPLPDDPWTRGKGGYKLIQYMAAGVPAIGSRVGANCEIIEDGVSGFLAGSTDEWMDKLERLITDEALRERFSQAGRHVVRERYSLEANYPAWLRALTEW